MIWCSIVLRISIYLRSRPERDVLATPILIIPFKSCDLLIDVHFPYKYLIDHGKSSEHNGSLDLRDGVSL